jgi:hypothetical protein
MDRKSALLSIGAALIFSLFCFGVGHAFQIDRNQDARILMAGHMNGTANLSTKHVSHTPNPCTESGQGRTGAPGKQRCPLGSGAMAPDGSLSTNQVSACGGRTGTTCREHSQPGSAAIAPDGYRDTSPTSAASMLFGVGITALVVLGARRLRHPHGHHA